MGKDIRQNSKGNLMHFIVRYKVSWLVKKKDSKIVLCYINILKFSENRKRYDDDDDDDDRVDGIL